MVKRLFLFLVFGCVANTFFAQLEVSTTPANKNVILEEFTGRNCDYCPNGHKIANEIAAANPGRFWAINIHKTSNFSPTTYPNLNTDKGAAIQNGFIVSGLPLGVVNRADEEAQDRNVWAQLVNEQLAQPSPINIAGIATIDEDARRLTIFVEAYYTANAPSATNYLTIALLQNNIEGSQNFGSTNPSQYLPNGNYNHLHVLRDIITPTWGEAINPTTQGTLYQNTYHYEIPEMIGNPNGVAVVLEDLELLTWIADEEKSDILTATKIEIKEQSDFPSLPDIAAVQEAGTLNVNISWSAPNLSKDVKTLDGYNLYRDGEKLNSSLLPPSQTTFSDVAPAFGYSHCYKITPVIDGANYYPNTYCVLMDVDLPAVTGVKAEQIEIGQKEMRISWEKPNVDVPISGYNVYRNDILLNTDALITELFLEDTGLSFREYCFEVEAVVGEIKSEKSEKICITLFEKATPPVNLKAKQTANNERSITLTWGAATGAGGYHIYRDETKINDEAVAATTYRDEVAEFGVEYCYTVKGVFSGAPGPESNKACATAIYTESITSDDFETALQIYPNPVADKLYVETELNVTEYQVFDLQGRLIHSSKTGAKEISTSEWASGVYIIKVTTEKGVVNKRFVKQ